jgi:hypothetical protein
MMEGSFMKWRVVVWVGSFATIFLFLPSLLFKIWDYLIKAPWEAKSWLFYILAGLAFIFWVRWRWRKKHRVGQIRQDGEASLLFLAKERLVKGEISLEEFREIRRELD